MKRKEIIPEEVFYNDVTTLIKNLLVDNINFKNGHYWSYNGISKTGELMNDVKSFAQLILDQIESTKHLINLE